MSFSEGFAVFVMVFFLSCV